MSDKRVDVRTMELSTDPSWSLFTTFSVNAVKLQGHTHGNRRYYKAGGPMFVTVDDTMVLLHRIIKEVFDG